MSIVTINVANKKFKISHNSNDQEELLSFVKTLDKKINNILAQNKLAPLELALVIIALKLEKHVALLNQENDQLKQLLHTNKKILCSVKERLQFISKIS